MARTSCLFSAASTHEEPAVNLTPLIDVVFVILIMFIVIAPLLELDQIELAESPSSGLWAAPQENSPITIHVDANNTIWFNHQTTSPAELTLLLKEAKGRFPQAHPQVIHDRKAHFGTYQMVKNAAETAGFAQMDIVLKTP